MGQEPFVTSELAKELLEFQADKSLKATAKGFVFVKTGSTMKVTTACGHQHLFDIGNMCKRAMVHSRGSGHSAGNSGSAMPLSSGARSTGLHVEENDEDLNEMAT